MGLMARKMMGAGNKAAAWVYRRTRGRIGGSAKGLPVLLLNVSGRKTGKPRTVPSHSLNMATATSWRRLQAVERPTRSGSTTWLPRARHTSASTRMNSMSTLGS